MATQINQPPSNLRGLPVILADIQRNMYQATILEIYFILEENYDKCLFFSEE